MTEQSVAPPEESLPPQEQDLAPDLGENVVVFDPSMPIDEIRAKVDAVSAAQVDNEMGAERYALLFAPGTYGNDEDPLQMTVGYYTEVAGLGGSPTDVLVNGKVEVFNRCLGDGGTSNCIALINFWRTLGNLTIDINGAGQDECRRSANTFAVSQAASMRRLNLVSDQGAPQLSLMDSCGPGPQYASGGFLADSRAGAVINGSQQQWITRNSSLTSWSNGNWNQVFSGVQGAPDDATFPNPPYTTLETTPLSREKPFLFIAADGTYNVRVPAARMDSAGVTWEQGEAPGAPSRSTSSSLPSRRTPSARSMTRSLEASTCY